MNAILRRLSPGILLFVLTTPALAEMPVPSVGVSTSSFIQGFLGLILIIGLLIGTLIALRRFSGRFSGAQTTGLKVISGISIGTRERILLVEVGDTWLVVGVTTTQIRTLHTLPKGSLPEAASNSTPGFADVLNRFKDRIQK